MRVLFEAVLGGLGPLLVAQVLPIPGTKGGEAGTRDKDSVREKYAFSIRFLSLTLPPSSFPSFLSPGLVPSRCRWELLHLELLLDLVVLGLIGGKVLPSPHLRRRKDGRDGLGDGREDLKLRGKVEGKGQRSRYCRGSTPPLYISHAHPSKAHNSSPSTHPLQLPQTVLPRAVELARGAVLVVHDGRGLQAVGEDDVGVHGRHVEVVDERGLLPAEEEEGGRGGVRENEEEASVRISALHGACSVLCHLKP